MKVCQTCNQTNPVEAMYCRQCASPLDASQPRPQQQYANPPQFNTSPFNQQQQQWNNPPQYVQTPQQFSQATGGASSRATQSAILAVVGLLCCGFITGIPAAIMGWLEIQAIKEGKSSSEGMMMAQVGLWLGIGGTIINAVVGFIGMLILMAGGGGY